MDSSTLSSTLSGPPIFMRILFCCELYHPSVGGVQEVMKQIAERLVKQGHEVTVATTGLLARNFDEFNGVKIQSFAISGNAVYGYLGSPQEIAAYQNFVANFSGDAILIKATKQWTFDLLWEILPKIKPKKVLIPCGFMALTDPNYVDYMECLPKIMHQFDELIYYTQDERDTEFPKQHRLGPCTLIPNGASQSEFDVPIDSSFRMRHGIPQESFVILLVGALTGFKGHLELAQAIAELNTKGTHVTLLLNGNNPFIDTHLTKNPNLNSIDLEKSQHEVHLLSKGFYLLMRKIYLASRSFLRSPRTFFRTLHERLNPPPPKTPYSEVQKWVEIINKSPSLGQVQKLAKIMDLPRAELVQAYLTANLFVFPSYREYSPLVLFEAAASATPFISSNAGNAPELTQWLEGGWVIDGEEDAQGYLRVSPKALSTSIEALLTQKDLLLTMGERMRKNWLNRFTWEKIALQYEKVLGQKPIQ